MAVSLNGTNGITFNDSSTQNTAATGFGFKNRIINGAMMIDQRNAGASITPTDGQYSVDRWKASLNVASKFSLQQSTTAPTGFKNSLLATSLSSYSIGAGEVTGIIQRIEGYNVADLNWGAAGASTVTLSFWVRSSLTGTFGGSLRNNAANRSYPFSYSISAANTWEQKSITITGDTSGTWLTDNGCGIDLYIALGAGSTFSSTAGSWQAGNFISVTGATSVVGTSGATFYITGVQLEKGSTATSFDYRPYGTELALCQRYYYKIQATAAADTFGLAFNESTTVANGVIFFPVTMRTKPTALEQSGTAADYRVRISGSNVACSGVPSYDASTSYNAVFNFTVASGLTANSASSCRSASASAYLAWSAEL